MCGRFVGTFTLGALIDELSLAAESANVSLPVGDASVLLCDDYNVAPTRLVPALRLDGDRLVLEAMRWGLVPTWAKELSKGQALVNARSETVHEKPTFRNLVRGNRCIVPMNGFYEWDRSDPRHKVPYYVPRDDGRLLLCVALWSRPTIMDGLATCALLTKQSESDLVSIHDRSPVHVDAERALDWLTSTGGVGEMVADHAPRLRPHRVSDLVNSVRNNGPNLIEPVSGHREDDKRELGPLFD